MIEEPESGSVWWHTSGRIYTVLFCRNEEIDDPKYPRSVVYVGQNGKLWSRPVADWHRSMTRKEIY